MDIRSALTDDYLTGFFDVATMARAPACVDRVRSLEIAQLTSGSLTATAQVWGTAPAPYHVQLHMEVDEASDWVFSACSCPVGRLCKHGAALAMVLRSGHLELPGARSAWQQRLDRLSREVATRAQASLEGVPLALEVSRRPANRWSRSAAGELALRPLRPGARRGWVKSGAEWTDLSQPVARGRFVPAHADALRALHRGLTGRHVYLVAGMAPLLDDFGDDLVPLLRAASHAGVDIVCGKGVESVRLAPGPVSVHGELTGGGDAARLEVVATDGERRWRGQDVVPVGRPATTLVLLEADSIVLADVGSPVSDAVVDLLVGPPLDVPADEVDSFLQALAPLVRHLELRSPDGSVEVPEPLAHSWSSP